jgi:hypothetical protein
MKSYGEDLFRHCKYHNCFSCDLEFVYEPKLKIGIRHDLLNRLYEIVFHLKNGPVRIAVSNLRTMFETNNIIEAVSYISKLTEQHVDVTRLAFDRSFVVLEVEKC